MYKTEPLQPDSPLLQMENVLASPHVGYVEKDSYDIYFRAAFENIVALANGTPQHVLNPQVMRS